MKHSEDQNFTSAPNLAGARHAGAQVENDGPDVKKLGFCK